MTLEEQIAEAIKSVWLDDGTIEWDDLARAVVAALPTADVGDEVIVDALYPHVLHFTDDAAYCGGECEWVAEQFGNGTARGQWAKHVATVVRALLDAQAAAHAAEVEAQEAENERLIAENERVMANYKTAEAEVDALRAEKASMTEAYQAASASLAKANIAIDNMDDNFDKQEAACEQALAEARADRDRAVAEALEHAAQKIEGEHGPGWHSVSEEVWNKDNPSCCGYCDRPWPCQAVSDARIVRGLIPKDGDA